MSFSLNKRYQRHCQKTTIDLNLNDKLYDNCHQTTVYKVSISYCDALMLYSHIHHTKAIEKVKFIDFQHRTRAHPKLIWLGEEGDWFIFDFDCNTQIIFYRANFRMKNQLIQSFSCHCMIVPSSSFHPVHSACACLPDCQPFLFYLSIFTAKYGLFI